MKVRIVIAAHAYAVIQNGPVHMEFRLSQGKSAPQSLRDTASEYEERAKELQRKAALARHAADLLD